MMIAFRFMFVQWCVLVFVCYVIFFFKQKTAYEMRISDWSSDVCSSDLQPAAHPHCGGEHHPSPGPRRPQAGPGLVRPGDRGRRPTRPPEPPADRKSVV